METYKVFGHRLRDILCDRKNHETNHNRKENNVNQVIGQLYLIRKHNNTSQTNTLKQNNFYVTHIFNCGIPERLKQDSVRDEAAEVIAAPTKQRVEEDAGF